MVDPPESAKAARASEATYGVYEGVVCGVVPRPDQGYTLRYPKIWIAREQGPATWLADNTDNQRLVGVVRSDPAPVGDVDLAASLADGWRVTGVPDLQLEPRENSLVGGQPAQRLNVHFTAANGTPMVGYSAALVRQGRLYRVEAALPADRYARLERAAAILAEQLIITTPAPKGG
jgi:hypothetical protein